MRDGLFCVCYGRFIDILLQFIDIPFYYMEKVCNFIV